MKLDLQKDCRTILRYFKKRAKDYPVYVNDGPGEDEDPIGQVTLGFQCDQAGWVALVFDTRQDANCDGEWQHYIEENWLELPHWCDICEALWEEDPKVELTTTAGEKSELHAGTSLAEVIGEFLRDLLLGCREDDVFGKLSFSDSCQMVVEEQSGQ